MWWVNQGSHEADPGPDLSSVTLITICTWRRSWIVLWHCWIHPGAWRCNNLTLGSDRDIGTQPRAAYVNLVMFQFKAHTSSHTLSRSFEGHHKSDIFDDPLEKVHALLNWWYNTKDGKFVILSDLYTQARQPLINGIKPTSADSFLFLFIFQLLDFYVVKAGSLSTNLLIIVILKVAGFSLRSRREKE